MASLKALKGRITSVKSTQKITKALKTVAAAKLRRSTEQAMAGRPYAERLEKLLANIASKIVVGPTSPKLLAGTGSDKTHLIVVVTSERGLAGGFNSNIVKLARRKADVLTAEGKTVRFYIAGRKGRTLRRFYPAANHHDHDLSAMRNAAFNYAQDIAQDLVARFEAGEFDVAHLIYSTFQSALVQEPTEKQLIPVQTGGDVSNVSTSSASAAVEYEPEEEEILATLLPRNVAIQLYRALLENQAGFYGSQMTAMDNATRNAGDMINRLSIQYNRTRQAAITKELIEIISGAEAL